MGCTCRLKTLPAPVWLPRSRCSLQQGEGFALPDQLPHSRPSLLLPVTSHSNDVTSTAPNPSSSSASQGPRIRQVSSHNHPNPAGSWLPLPQGCDPHAGLPPRPPGALSSDGTGPGVLLRSAVLRPPLTSAGHEAQSKAVFVWKHLFEASCSRYHRGSDWELTPLLVHNLSFPWGSFLTGVWSKQTVLRSLPRAPGCRSGPLGGIL